MRILVVDAAPDAELVARELSEAQHEVFITSDTDAALGMLATHAAEALVVESSLKGPISALDLVRRIRAQESASHTYVVVTTRERRPDDLRDAYLAGADDLVRKPLQPSELALRVEGLSRIRAWASRIFATRGQSEAELSQRPADMVSWTGLDVSIASDLSEMVGHTLMPVPSKGVPASSSYVAMMELPLATGELSLRLRMGVDAETASALAVLLFGEAQDADAFDDMIREMVNVAGGAFKRISACEGKDFAMGVPQTLATPVAAPTTLAFRGWRCDCQGLPLQLHFDAELVAA